MVAKVGRTAKRLKTVEAQTRKGWVSREARGERGSVDGSGGTCGLGTSNDVIGNSEYCEVVQSTNCVP